VGGQVDGILANDFEEDDPDEIDNETDLYVEFSLTIDF
jgi:hypothetical protein